MLDNRRARRTAVAGGRRGGEEREGKGEYGEAGGYHLVLRLCLVLLSYSRKPDTR